VIKHVVNVSASCAGSSGDKILVIQFFRCK